MITLNVLQDFSEIVPYKNPHIPLYIGEHKLSNYAGMRAMCHWHEDIEFIKAVHGHMTYYVNGEKITLREKDALLINGRQMHYAASDDKSDCTFIGILFQPQFLTPSAEIAEKYISPIIRHMSLPYYYLDSSRPETAAMIDLFDKVYDTYFQKETGYELIISGLLLNIWVKWFRLLEPVLQERTADIDGNLTIQKNMITFIYQNYTSKITLQDIAAAGKVCRSKCCKIFKKYLNQTPLDFVNSYRLEISLRLLLETTMNITEIALSCGFQSPSYYSELFRRHKGCSPSEYRSFLPGNF